jgi:endo-1,4-beta-D-glucanase Y
MDNITFQKVILEKIDEMSVKLEKIDEMSVKLEKIDEMSVKLEKIDEMSVKLEKIDETATEKFSQIMLELLANREFQKRTTEKFDEMTTENQKFQQLVLKHFSILTTDVSDLKLRFNKFEIRMENEVIDKIKILFDEYQCHDDEIKLLKQHL